MVTHTLKITWGTSRGRDTYGYTTAVLRDERNRKRAACNGGGYDMRGTVFAGWLADEYRERLLQLTPADMPAQSHWERDDKPQRFCEDSACRTKHGDASPEAYGHDVYECPRCGSGTYADPRAGRRVDDGRYFYGLSYHDPNYDPGKAVIGQDAIDRTFGGAEGETVEQAEAAGKSLGLERYQAFYRASSKYPTEQHTVPLIDGACGFESVRRIAEALGLQVRTIDASKRLDIIEVTDTRAEVAA